MSKKPKAKTPLPPHLWKRGRNGQVVCQCGTRYGSEYDGLCFNCRGGVPAIEAKLREKNTR